MNIMNIKRLPVVLVLLVLISWCAPSSFGNIFSLAEAATLVVQNSNDSGPGSLRQTIEDASPWDVIVFDSDAVIRVTGILISKDLTIDGNGHSVTLSGDTDNNGSPDSGYIFMTGHSPLEGPFYNITLRGLRIVKAGLGIYNRDHGILTVENCTISGNSNGAGIYNGGGTLTVRNSTISENSMSGNGGGIRNWNGPVTVEGCTISGNSASGSGGGIFNDGILTVRNSTIFGNAAASKGGGIASYHGLTLTNVTVSGNTSYQDQGGGIRVFSGALTLRNTIIAKNNGIGKDCVVDNNDLIVENTNNLVEDGSCSDKGVNFQSGDHLLGPLADNGGPTLTMALLAGSPAIDAADAATATDTDQRGNSRVGARDIGAFEYTGLYTLTYTAGAHGSITGASPQTVNEGGSGTAVTAVADPGYRFLRWTDGSTVNPRTDSNVTANNSVTARFFSETPIVVQNSNDSGPGSLRQAIEDASPWDMIIFDSDAVITLSSELAISKDLAIDGNGHSVTLAGGMENFDNCYPVRVFNISAGHDVTLRGLRIARGGLGNYPQAEQRGAGILNAGTLAVEDCTFHQNDAWYAGYGGGIYNTGTLTVEDCTFSSNHASKGGGIYNAGTLTVLNSTFAGNLGVAGIYSTGTLTQPLTLINVTLANSGIYVERGALTFRNTIDAGGGCNLDRTKALIAENTNNLVQDGSCSDNGVNFHSGDPLLGPLADNGGPTLTMALLAGSPAIDAADAATATDTDQRGNSGVGARDIGAFEYTGLCTLTYTAGSHGSISGVSPQTVNEGGSGTSVTAAPDPGYRFVRWSDGSTVNPRTDSNVTGNIKVTARFSNMTSRVVQNSNDSGPGSLRQAIADANPWDVIAFDSDAVITLSGELAISKDLTIDGNGHSVTLSGDTDNDGSPNVRIFNISVLHDVTLRGLSITKGGGSGINGGGIFNAGSLTVENCTVSGNSVTDTDDGDGGSVGGFGGGICNSWLGTLTVRNTTISDNSADDYGGIVSSGPLTLINVTLSGNTYSGTGYNIMQDGGGTLTLRNTIIAGGPESFPCMVRKSYYWGDYPVVENTNNFVQDCVINGVIVHSGDPLLLGPLADNGGPTPTMALLAGSPAIDAADATTAPATDQRGYSRAGDPDIGAFEYGGVPAHTLTYSAGAGGSITGSSPQTVNHGGSGTAVAAVADTGYHFARWSDGSTANPRTDTNVTDDISVTAEFAINTHTLTYTAGAHGSITGTSPQTVNHGAGGTPVTAVADTGYHFVRWSDGSTANPRTDTDVTGDISVTAEFAINTHTLTYTSGAHGSITGSSPQTVNHGAGGTPVTAVADTGYHFARWSDGSTANPRTDTNVTADVNVTAQFAINTYTVTPSAGANGGMSPDTPQMVSHGSTTSFTVTPDQGYRISSASGCGGTLSGTTFTTGAITADCTVTATLGTNTAPAASADTYDVDLGQSLAVTSPGVLANDTDGDGDSLTATLVSGPAHATAFALNGNGSFTYTHDGTHTGNDHFTYKAHDGNGGESAATTVTLVVHNIAPDAPVIISPATGTRTNNAKPTITGTSEALMTVELYDSTALIGSTTAAADGKWTIIPASALSRGTHPSITARAIDAAGNTSPASAAISLTIDGASLTGIYQLLLD